MINKQNHFLWLCRAILGKCLCNDCCHTDNVCVCVAYVCVALVPWSAMLYQFQRNAHSKMVFIFDVSSKSFIWLFVLVINKVMHGMCLFTFKKIIETTRVNAFKKNVCLMEINGGVFFFSCCGHSYCLHICFNLFPIEDCRCNVRRRQNIQIPKRYNYFTP